MKNPPATAGANGTSAAPRKPHCIILWDIDCTLIDTGGAGMAALQTSISQLLGMPDYPLDLAGSTDRGILQQIGGKHQLRIGQRRQALFWQHYTRQLQKNLPLHQGKVLEGVHALLESLGKQGCYHALLTGNIKAGAMAKLQHYGLQHYFSTGAFGDDHHDRNLLGGIAKKRLQAKLGKHCPDKYIIIGDTPKDIACAQANNFACVAVASGNFSKQQLSSHRPQLAVDSLEEDGVGSFILQTAKQR